MDKLALVGLIVGIAAVLGGATLDGTPVQSLVNFPAFLIVILGTLGATSLSYPASTMIRLPSLVLQVFRSPSQERAGLIDTFVNLATQARRDGLLSLEKETSAIADRFLRRGVELVVDGADESVIQQVLDAEISSTEERHRVGYSVFDTMGGFSPTLGIMGAVLGLIHVLSKVDDPTKLASGIAVAFVATLYGVGTANLIFFPMANKLRILSEEEGHLRRLIVHGILAIHAGDNPRVVRQKLEAYLSPRQQAALHRREETAAADAASALAAGRR
jgi:chemotaxis protein MotA